MTHDASVKCFLPETRRFVILQVTQQKIVNGILKVEVVLMNDDRDAERITIQMQLNRLHDEWMISVTRGDLEASDRLWHEMDVVYQKLRDLLPITPTG